jgi:NADH:ubiquinone oxidoreductase subunit 6 (subunit J)
MPTVQHASQIAWQDKQQVTAQDATQAIRQHALVGVLVLVVALSLSMQTASAQTNTVRYDDIAAKAKQVQGPAVAISTNYFLAWTGAGTR